MTTALPYEIWLIRKTDGRGVLYTNKRFQTVQHARAWIDENGTDYTDTEWSYKVEFAPFLPVNPGLRGLR